MPTIFDVLYREYCRARLAEMRKQLLLWPGIREVAELNRDADRDDTTDQAMQTGSSQERDSQVRRIHS
jgi:hypothetical protein